MIRYITNIVSIILVPKIEVQKKFGDKERLIQKYFRSKKMYLIYFVFKTNFIQKNLRS